MRSWMIVVAIAGTILGSGPHAWTQQQRQDPAPGALGDMTLHIIPQSHIDLAWWWRYDPETLQIVAKHTLETALGNMEKYPDYTFTYLQVPAIEPLETLSPDLFYRLRYYVHNKRAIGEGLPNPGAGGANGRLAIGSAAWCEFDGSLPSGESLVRQFLYGKRYFRDQFGIDVKTAWVQDAWTHPWTLPQILRKCGVESYLFTRPRDQGELMFWWQSPDGSRVLACKPLAMESSLPPQRRIDERLLEVHHRYGVKDGFAMVGVGNHGGGALQADVERMRALLAKRTTQNPGEPMPPKMLFSTPEHFIEAVLRGPHELPVLKTEIEPTIRGAYTTVGEIKTANRRSESLLTTLETFSAIALRLGERPYPKAAIASAWKKVMLNQFHDTISGTEIQPAIDDTLLRYREVVESCQAELRACLSAICGRINTEGRGAPVVVFNPSAWDRTDVVEIDLESDAAPASVQLTDLEGKRVAAQIVRDRVAQRKHAVTVAFVADGVPSLGYKSYRLGLDPSPHPLPTSLQSRANEIENASFRVEIDPTTGCLRSIFDKRQNREVLAATGHGNLIQVLEDFGDSEGFLKSADGTQEHNEWTGKCWDVTADPRMELVERGPVRTALEVKRTFGLARFTQRITLCDAIPRIDFSLSIDWNGENKMVKVCFPLAVSCPEATYEIPYGFIRRPSRGQEEGAQKWVDISTEDYGVSLLNDSRYGYDVTPNAIRLSVLRSPAGPVQSHNEKGTERVKYSLYPHSGSWQNARVVRRGYELNNPLIAVVDSPHRGDLPGTYSFARIEPPNVVLTVVKKAEDGEQLIARSYESEGKGVTARITLAPPLSVDAVHTTDLLENSQQELAAEPGGFSAEIPAYSINTYKLIKD